MDYKLQQSMRAYLESDNEFVLFVTIDSSDYIPLLTEFGDIESIKLSDYCRDDDSYPDLDSFCNTVSSRVTPALLLGISEYSELTNDRSILNRIKDLTIQTKIIVVCRFANGFIKEICDYDKKFAERRIINHGMGKLPVITYTSEKLHNSDKFALIQGFKNLIKEMEGDMDLTTTYCVYTRLKIPSRKKINPYNLCNVEGVDEAILTPEQWRLYYQDSELEGVPYDHWRFFLKIKLQGTPNSFLRTVANKSKNYAEYCKQLLFSLLDVDHHNPDYWEIYSKRKEILRNHNFPPEDCAEYLGEVRSRSKDGIYYLTDTSELERNAIIEWIVDNKRLPDHLECIYPALHHYLSKYKYRSKFGDQFSDYFEAYRHCKIFNDCTQEYLSLVEQLATSDSHPYDLLDYRDSIINKCRDKNTYLIWIDALGVEYLSYIQFLINQYNYNSETNICRAYLPSITENNSQFFEDWPYNKEKVSAFDELLHDGPSDLSLDCMKYPYHLPIQLDIIDRVMTKVATLLNQGKYRKIILASDHGASRFARIIDGKTVKMTNPGKKSGRCCEESDEDSRLPTMVSENGYLSMSNYDRFQSGKKQGVELHGGATLEEVLVPVVVLYLKDESIKFTLKTPSVTYNFDEGFDLIVSTNTRLSDIYAVISNNRYTTIIQDYEIIVRVDAIKRTGSYVLQLFSGDSLLVSLPFEVNGKSAKFNKMGDDWFN